MQRNHQSLCILSLRLRKCFLDPGDIGQIARRGLRGPHGIIDRKAVLAAGHADGREHYPLMLPACVLGTPVSGALSVCSVSGILTAP